MEQLHLKLTVYFNDPFWVGVFELIVDDHLTVSKVTFGKEPKDQEVLDYILNSYNKLQLSPPVDIYLKNKKVNSKRKLKEARKSSTHTLGTKSQQALQLQREENKLIKKTISKQQREEEKKRLYYLKQQKRKEKHRGR